MFKPTYLQIGRLKVDIEVFREGIIQIGKDNESILKGEE